MTSYFSDNWDLYTTEKFNFKKFVIKILNNNALVNGSGLVCGIVSVLVVL